MDRARVRAARGEGGELRDGAGDRDAAPVRGGGPPLRLRLARRQKADARGVLQRVAAPAAAWRRAGHVRHASLPDGGGPAGDGGAARGAAKRHARLDGAAARRVRHPADRQDGGGGPRRPATALRLAAGRRVRRRPRLPASCRWRRGAARADEVRARARARRHRPPRPGRRRAARRRRRHRPRHRGALLGWSRRARRGAPPGRRAARRGGAAVSAEALPRRRDAARRAHRIEGSVASGEVAVSEVYKHCGSPLS
mmetsp:Transcript_1343/g.4267  ORF Transcript_1343/g.4267 Transcript_1343/m.4267 type:complete len:254 (-) Transcript_1343:90-851(-)